jgi:hypothetical protein
MSDDSIECAPFHIWGDEDFDWAALDKASYYLSSKCRNWARLGLWTKEKYGTLRVSITCAYFTEYDFIHHIFYPGYCRYTFPKWFRVWIDWPFGKLLKKIGIIWMIQKYQQWILKYFWNKAAKKWPHIAEEILDEYEFYFPKGENN